MRDSEHESHPIHSRCSSVIWAHHCFCFVYFCVHYQDGALRITGRPPVNLWTHDRHASPVEGSTATLNTNNVQTWHLLNLVLQEAVTAPQHVTASCCRAHFYYMKKMKWVACRSFKLAHMVVVWVMDPRLFGSMWTTGENMVISCYVMCISGWIISYWYNSNHTIKECLNQLSMFWVICQLFKKIPFWCSLWIFYSFKHASVMLT